MNYQLLKEDDETFTVKHPDGEEFSVAKHGISKTLQDKIRGLNPIQMAEGGEVPDSEELMSSQSIPVDLNPTLGLNTPMNDSSLLAAPLTTPAVIPSAGTPTAVDATQSNISNQFAKQFALKKEGIEGVAKAQSEANKEIATAYQNQLEQDTKAIAETAQKRAKLDEDHTKLINGMMNDKVDPHRMWSNMSTGNKVLAAISIALSGIGSGLTGKPNMAMGVIQGSIDRDIDAQKSELGKKHNLLSENLRQYGNLNDAAMATRLQLNAATQASIGKAAAISGSKQALEQAKILNSDLGLQAAQMKNQLAIRQQAMSGSNSDPAMFVPHLVPEKHQEDVYKEIERAQDTRRMGDSILKAFDQAANENTVLKTGAGLLRTPPGVLGLHQAMQPTFKDLEGTVRQAAMDNTFKNITPQPGDMPSTISSKRESLQDYLKSKASAPRAKSFRIDLDRFGSTTTSRPEIKTMGGVQYQKVPGGWARVK